MSMTLGAGCDRFPDLSEPSDLSCCPTVLTSRRPLPLLLICALVLSLGAAPARAQTQGPCFDDTEETPEGYGPTDISAVTGNGHTSVALNQEGTVTVFKWPSPSYYDQIK